MKAFERKEETNFTYPEDMEKIIQYVEKRGTLNVSYKTLEKLYYEFSEEKFGAGWMDIDTHLTDYEYIDGEITEVTKSILDYFIKWLEEYII